MQGSFAAPTAIALSGAPTFILACCHQKCGGGHRLSLERAAVPQAVPAPPLRSGPSDAARFLARPLCAPPAAHPALPAAGAVAVGRSEYAQGSWVALRRGDRSYHRGLGAGAFALGAAVGQRRGGDRPASARWSTFRQARALGRYMRRGEEGETVCYLLAFTPGTGRRT